MERRFEGMGEDRPITPHAAPILDGDGHLTYVGDDGRRYVVGLPPEADEESVERVMATLRRGGSLFQQIEQLCHRWIGEVSGPDLEARAALVLLLTTLETALEDRYPEQDPDP
ncbi:MULTISPECIES: hypothetical protein [Aphanothece]|uniref:hypothetical protein n=1 Tax=Aphanothece TaxID=1121 RepID=UPI003984B086